MKQIKYNVNELSDFDREWLLHKKCSEWWYATSILKDENYKIIPIIDGQMNLAYFEQLCYIYNKDNKEVGMCFVELLPGVYNQKIDGKLLLKKI